jgi:hypothetical protein
LLSVRVYDIVAITGEELMSEATVVGRIGRKPMPGEGTVQMLRERPEVLEFMAMTEFANERDILGINMESEWIALPVTERAERIERVFVDTADGGAAYDASLPPDLTPPSGGGQSVLQPDGVQLRTA